MRKHLFNVTFGVAVVGYFALCMGGCDGTVQAAADAAPEQWLKIADPPGGGLAGESGLFVTHDLENGYICYVVRAPGHRISMSCHYEGLMEDEATQIAVPPPITEHRL